MDSADSSACIHTSIFVFFFFFYKKKVTLKYGCFQGSIDLVVAGSIISSSVGIESVLPGWTLCAVRITLVHLPLRVIIPIISNLSHQTVKKSHVDALERPVMDLGS